MSRELAGVIACMQQIEVACEELGEKADPQASQSVQTILGKVRAFFGNAGLETVRDVQAAIKTQGNLQGAGLLDSTITVDSLQTTLSQLAFELDEVIDDLENGL